jgi:tail sheath protein
MMSETITEMILPGTYIEVRSEGLIGVGGIATGNVGVVGTASRGPLRQVVVLGSYQEALDTFGPYDRWPDNPTPDAQAQVLSLTRVLEQVFSGGASSVYAVRIASVANMASMSWTLTSATNATLLTLTASSPGTWANAINPTLSPPDAMPVTLTLTLGRVKETFTGANAGELAQSIRDGSRFVTVSGPADADKGTVPKNVVASNVAGGPNGAQITATEIATGLAALENQPVNVVVAGGVDASMTGFAAAILTHLEATENEGRERIALIGASSDDPATIIANDVSKGSSPRLILVAPRIVATDANRAGQLNPNVNLPASYAAALVAGKLATLAPHISLTNQGVAAADLATDYSRAQQKQLLGNQVLVLFKHLGIRVLKGITTDTGAFRQISVRRIVDYAKAGVRIGANPYIGHLNNPRVRAALKATLDGFLSGMVLDEMLTAYQLDVSATRAQEINGQAIVTMTLQPTFSIDYIRVIMNLQ